MLSIVRSLRVLMHVAGYGGLAYHHRHDPVPWACHAIVLAAVLLDAAVGLGHTSRRSVNSGADLEDQED